MSEEPPRKKSKAALGGLAFCISGTLTVTRKVFESYLLENGATLASGATKNTAYLVCTHAEVSAQTSKVRQAVKNGVPCVSEQFVRDAVDHGSIGPGDDSLRADPVHVATSTREDEDKQEGGARPKGGSSAGPGGEAPTAVPPGEALSVLAARNVMLAKSWSDGQDPTGWWISEKLDGVRAYWDGANFYSRQGNPFPAPEWFKEGLPRDEPLDGELWCGRQKFRQALSIVKNSGSGRRWEFVTYLVFDAPARPPGEPYEARVAHVAAVVRHRATTPWAKAVGTARCSGLAHLRDELAAVEKRGGEGLMLRQPLSAYQHGARSAALLKVKSFHDEEARVVAHEPSKSKTLSPGACGALLLETPDGRRFSCGSGMTDMDRGSPPEVGSVVTYRYTELSQSGCPRFPRYVGPRIDLEWGDYCASYVVPVPPAALVPSGLQRENSLLYTAKFGLAGASLSASSASSSFLASSSALSASASPSYSSLSSSALSSAAETEGGGGAALAAQAAQAPLPANGKTAVAAEAKAAVEPAVSDGEEETAMVQVTWEWRNGKEWVEYEQEDAALLESSFSGFIRGSSGSSESSGSSDSSDNRVWVLYTSAFTFNRNVGSNYTVNFKNMTQVNHDSGTARKIRRIETRY